MSNDDYKKTIIGMIEKIENTKFLISICSFVKVKFEKDKKGD